jgi:hypothetical protein
MSNRSQAIFTAILISAIAFAWPLTARSQQANQPPSSQPTKPPETERVLPETARVLVDAYETAHVNGLVFITGLPSAAEQNLFGLRFLAYQPGGGVDESPHWFELGAHAPDGSYASVSWRPQFNPKAMITLRWSRVGKQLVAAQLSASANVRVAIEAYRPWSNEQNSPAWASYAAQSDRRSILGEQIHSQKNKLPLRNFLLRTDRAALGAANYNDVKNLRMVLVRDGLAENPLPGLRGILTFDLSPNAPVGFVAAVGDEHGTMQSEAETLMQKPVVELLDKAEANYGAIRTLSGGALGESLEAINRVTMWNRFFQAAQGQEYVTMHRLSGQGMRGDALGWDSLLVTAMTGLADGAIATATLRVLLAGQTPDGRIPLRRYLQSEPSGEPPVLAGRSMPPLGAMCALKAYLITQDLSFLAWAYPRLQQWNDWWLANRGDGEAWRDGNKDGLLECGFDAEVEYGALGARTLSNADKRRLAFAESGFADRPQWMNTQFGKIDATVPPPADSSQSSPPPQALPNDVKYNDQSHTLEFSSVALNSLYAMDTELIAQISREIGLTTESDRWQARYDGIKKRINEKLWSEEDGLYLDRHWDGRFSRRVSLENFYPLIAGIPDEARARRMLAVLWDPKKFGGEWMLPSIARDDPAFARKASEQTATTGAVNAAMNYLLYLGLKRYGFYTEAAQLARSSTAMARAALERQGEQPSEIASEKKGILFDLFASTTGQPIDDSHRSPRTSFVGQMFLPGIEEVIAADPWSGLTIGGMVVTEELRIERVKIADTTLDVLIGPKRTVVRRGDKIEVEFEAPVRLRGYRSNDRALTFSVEAKAEVRALIPGSEGRKVTVSVNDKVLGSTSPGAAATFKVKPGLSRVLIVR